MTPLFPKVLLPVLFAIAHAAEPSVKISPQSIECHYTTTADAPAHQGTRCTVRLHVTPSKGAFLWLQAPHTEIPHLEATDGNGNKLIGQFRDWETCFDSDANCQIMVYDFNALPAGNTLHFDTTLRVPLSPGIQKHDAPTFSTKETTRFTIAGHAVEVTPLPKSPAAPGHIVLKITYNGASRVPEIIVCDDEGYHLKSNIIDAEHDSATDTTTAVYVQQYHKKQGKLALRTYQPTIKVSAPVKFDASIGRKPDTDK